MGKRRRLFVLCSDIQRTDTSAKFSKSRHIHITRPVMFGLSYCDNVVTRFSFKLCLKTIFSNGTCYGPGICLLRESYFKTDDLRAL